MTPQIIRPSTWSDLVNGTRSEAIETLLQTLANPGRGGNSQLTRDCSGRPEGSDFSFFRKGTSMLPLLTFASGLVAGIVGVRLIKSAKASEKKICTDSDSDGDHRRQSAARSRQGSDQSAPGDRHRSDRHRKILRQFAREIDPRSSGEADAAGQVGGGEKIQASQTLDRVGRTPGEGPSVPEESACLGASPRERIVKRRRGRGSASPGKITRAFTRGFVAAALVTRLSGPLREERAAILGTRGSPPCDPGRYRAGGGDGCRERLASPRLRLGPDGGGRRGDRIDRRRIIC